MGIDNLMDDLDINCCDIFDSDIADSYHNHEIEYREIPGYERYRIYKDGTIKRGWETNERTLKHSFPNRCTGPRVSLRKDDKTKGFLVAKILVSVFIDTEFDFTDNKARVWYRDNNPRNISLQNII